jgi:hypothetical protein
MQMCLFTPIVLCKCDYVCMYADLKDFWACCTHTHTHTHTHLKDFWACGRTFTGPVGALAFLEELALRMAGTISSL